MESEDTSESVADSVGENSSELGEECAQLENELNDVIPLEAKQDEIGNPAEVPEDLKEIGKQTETGTYVVTGKIVKPLPGYMRPTAASTARYKPDPTVKLCYQSKSRTPSFSSSTNSMGIQFGSRSGSASSNPHKGDGSMVLLNSSRESGSGVRISDSPYNKSSRNKQRFSSSRAKANSQQRMPDTFLVKQRKESGTSSATTPINQKKQIGTSLQRFPLRTVKSHGEKEKVIPPSKEIPVRKIPPKTGRKQKKTLSTQWKDNKASMIRIDKLKAQRTTITGTINKTTRVTKAESLSTNEILQCKKVTMKPKPKSIVTKGRYQKAKSHVRAQGTSGDEQTDDDIDDNRNIEMHQNVGGGSPLNDKDLKKKKDHSITGTVKNTKKPPSVQKNLKILPKTPLRNRTKSLEQPTENIRHQRRGSATAKVSTWLDSPNTKYTKKPTALSGSQNEKRTKKLKKKRTPKREANNQSLKNKSTQDFSSREFLPQFDFDEDSKRMANVEGTGNAASLERSKSWNMNHDNAGGSGRKVDASESEISDKSNSDSDAEPSTSKSQPLTQVSKKKLRRSASSTDREQSSTLKKKVAGKPKQKVSVQGKQKAMSKPTTSAVKKVVKKKVNATHTETKKPLLNNKVSQAKTRSSTPNNKVSLAKTGPSTPNNKVSPAKTRPSTPETSHQETMSMSSSFLYSTPPRRKKRVAKKKKLLGKGQNIPKPKKKISETKVISRFLSHMHENDGTKKSPKAKTKAKTTISKSSTSIKGKQHGKTKKKVKAVKKKSKGMMPAQEKPVDSRVALLKDQFRIFARFGDRRNTGLTISMSNTVRWLKQARVVGRKVTPSDIEIYFIFTAPQKRRSLNMQEFFQFVTTLCREKALNTTVVVDRMISCGEPEASITDVTIETLLSSNETGQPVPNPNPFAHPLYPVHMQALNNIPYKSSPQAKQLIKALKIEGRGSQVKPEQTIPFPVPTAYFQASGKILPMYMIPTAAEQQDFFNALRKANEVKASSAESLDQRNKGGSKGRRPQKVRGQTRLSLSSEFESHHKYPQATDPQMSEAADSGDSAHDMSFGSRNEQQSSPEEKFKHESGSAAYKKSEPKTLLPQIDEDEPQCDSSLLNDDADEEKVPEVRNITSYVLAHQARAYYTDLSPGLFETNNLLSLPTYLSPKPRIKKSKHVETLVEKTFVSSATDDTE